MLDLRTAIAETCTVQARIGDDRGRDDAPEGGVPDLTLSCWLVDASGDTICEVFPPYEGVRLEPADDGSCRVMLRRGEGLLDAGSVSDAHDDFEGAVARALLALDLGMGPGADAPSVPELKRAAQERRASPLLVSEATASRRETLLWDSAWTLGLSEPEADEMEARAQRAIGAALDAAGGSVVVSSRAHDGSVSFSFAHPSDLSPVGGDVVVMDVADELVIRRGGSTVVPRLTDRPMGALARASQTELGLVWVSSSRVCASRRVNEGRPAPSRPETLRQTTARLAHEIGRDAGPGRGAGERAR